MNCDAIVKVVLYTWRTPGVHLAYIWRTPVARYVYIFNRKYFVILLTYIISEILLVKYLFKYFCVDYFYFATMLHLANRTRQWKVRFDSRHSCDRQTVAPHYGARIIEARAM